MNPIHALIFVSILFGANAQSLLDNLSDSYSLTGTGVFVANYSGNLVTTVYTYIEFTFDDSNKLQYFYGHNTLNGTKGYYSYLFSETDLYSWQISNGVCTGSELPDGYAQRVWNDFVVDPVDPNTFVYTPDMATVAITLGNDGIPTSIYTTSTTPYFVPFTFNITVTNFNNLDTPFTTFILPEECVGLGFTCAACYSSGMMVTSSILLLLCAVLLQFLFHAL